MSSDRLSEGRVAIVALDCSVAEAARLMNLFSVGALVIAESQHAVPQGIVTDRDLVKLIGDGLDPKIETVSRFAASPPTTARIGSTTEELLAAMRKAGVRRLPLVDGEGRLAGIVSLDELLVRLGREMGDVAAAIEKELGQEHPVSSAHDRAL